MSKQPPTRTFCKCNRPLPYYHPNCRTPRQWKFTQNHRTTRPPPKLKEVHFIIVNCKMNIRRLVGCFGFSGPLRQYFSLYRAVSQRDERKRRENIEESKKMCKHPTSAPTASAIGPCLTFIQIVGRPGTGSLPKTIAPLDHDRYREANYLKYQEEHLYFIVFFRPYNETVISKS